MISVNERLSALGYHFAQGDKIKVGMVASQLYLDEFNTHPEKRWSQPDGREVNIYPPHIVTEAIHIVRDRHEEWKEERRRNNRFDIPMPDTHEPKALNLVLRENIKSIEVLKVKIRNLEEQNFQIKQRLGDPNAADDDLLCHSPYSSEENEIIRGWLEGSYIPDFWAGLSCVVDGRTDLSIKCVFGGLVFWLPLSRIEVHREWMENNTVYVECDVPLWLIKSNGVPVTQKPFGENKQKSNEALLRSASSSPKGYRIPEDAESVPVVPCRSNAVLGEDWYENFQQEESLRKQELQNRLAARQQEESLRKQEIQNQLAAEKQRQEKNAEVVKTLEMKRWYEPDLDSWMENLHTGELWEIEDILKKGSWTFICVKLNESEVVLTSRSDGSWREKGKNLYESDAFFPKEKSRE